MDLDLEDPLMIYPTDARSSSSSDSESSSDSSAPRTAEASASARSGSSSLPPFSCDDVDGPKRPRLIDFMETCRMFNNREFKRHFRINRNTMAGLVDRYTASDEDYQHIGADREIHMFVWYISNTLNFQQLAYMFGVSESTAWRVVNRTSKWVISLANEFIRWPTGSVLTATEQKFRSKHGIPGVIGVVAVSHIRIKAQPGQHKSEYNNRKGNPTISLQAVVDADGKFIDLYCGEPGSLPASRVLRRSDLYKLAVTNMNELFPDNTFIIGDAEYGVRQWLVPAFNDVENTTDQQKHFNIIMSSTRLVAGKAFNLVKGRFRRLLEFQGNGNINFIVNTMVCACIMHNICLLAKDHFESNYVDEHLIDNDMI